MQTRLKVPSSVNQKIQASKVRFVEIFRKVNRNFSPTDVYVTDQSCFLKMEPGPQLPNSIQHDQQSASQVSLCSQLGGRDRTLVPMQQEFLPLHQANFLAELHDQIPVFYGSLENKNYANLSLENLFNL